jgi:zinc transport system substrate-binding protein
MKRFLVPLVLLSSAAWAQAPINVVVSLHPHFDLVRQLTGDAAVVTRVLPIGASPHTFDPTPRDVARIADADLVIFNGGIDEWLLDLVAASGTDAEVFELLEELEFEPVSGELHGHDEAAHDDDAHDDGHDDHGGAEQGEHAHDEHEGDEHAGEHGETVAESAGEHGTEHSDDHSDDHSDGHGDEHSDEHDDHGDEAAHAENAGEDAHDHSGVNPHVWTDPVLMAQAVPLFVEALSEVDPDNAETYAANGEDLVERLEALHAEISETLAPVGDAPFVPFHDAWPYFVRRYDLNQVAVIEPAPGREPSPSYVAEVLAQLEQSGATAIFNDVQLPPRSAEVVAEAAGLELYTLDPEGGGVSDDETYEEFMRKNAETVAEALGR